MDRNLTGAAERPILNASRAAASLMVAAVVVAGASACQPPDVASCAITCGAGGLCPSGFRCVDGLCEDQRNGPACGARGDSGPGAEGDSGSIGDRYNIAFVTSAPFSGDLGGLAGADDICAEAAMGLPENTYVAWLSDGNADAVTRLGDARGWIRPDGKPFADTIDDIVAGRILYPLRVQEDGQQVEPSGGISLSVWTGTQADGTAVVNRCGGWLSDASSVDGAQGHSFATAESWTHDNAALLDCSEERRLYCFGIDRTEPLELSSTSGRVAFVTDEPFLPAEGGVAIADNLCATQASQAGFTGTFRALLATADQSAAARFVENGPTWIRPDGIPLAATAQEVLDGDWQVPLNVEPDGTYVKQPAWTGLETTTGSLREPSDLERTCTDWTQSIDTSLSERAGQAQFSGRAGYRGRRVACDADVRLYCLED